MAAKIYRLWFWISRPGTMKKIKERLRRLQGGNHEN